MIEVVGLTKQYGGRLGYTAIEDITLTVRDGSIYGLVGYNGAGKTTLLKTIAGIYRPTKGTVRVSGAPAPGTLFIVADEPYFISQATPATMAGFYRGYYPEWSDEVFVRMLEIFELDLQARIEGFSKGMQRQCGIALGFASGVKTLLLDESFDGLDLAKRILIKRLVKSYAQTHNASVLLTSHNLLEIEDISDDLGMLDGCSLVFSGSVASLRQEHPGASLEEIFLAQGRGVDTVDVDEIWTRGRF